MTRRQSTKQPSTGCLTRHATRTSPWGPTTGARRAGHPRSSSSTWPARPSAAGSEATPSHAAEASFATPNSATA